MEVTFNQQVIWTLLAIFPDRQHFFGRLQVATVNLLLLPANPIQKGNNEEPSSWSLVMTREQIGAD